MTDRVWILGAADPEMEAIEKLLRACGETVIHALDASRERVRGASAYRAFPPDFDDDAITGPDGCSVAYWVECAADGEPAASVQHVTIDHHRPGDPGYGRPPEEFLAASSLGQVITELARLSTPDDRLIDCHSGCEWLESSPQGDHPGRLLSRPPLTWDDDAKSYWWVEIAWTDARYGERVLFERIPRDLVLIAAADHCLGAAYRGECPGVDPDELPRQAVRGDEDAAQVARVPLVSDGGGLAAPGERGGVAGGAGSPRRGVTKTKTPPATKD